MESLRKLRDQNSNQNKGLQAIFDGVVKYEKIMQKHGIPMKEYESPMEIIKWGMEQVQETIQKRQATIDYVDEQARKRLRPGPD